MKRWNPREEGPYMDRAHDGLYVAYEDYESLQAHNQELVRAAEEGGRIIVAEIPNALKREIKDLRWLIENGGGPTHAHSTDYEPSCLACKWDIRYKKLFKEEEDD